MAGPEGARPPAAASGIPPVAGRYELLREIGRGGMGSVWLARDRRLGRLVAAKRIGLAPGRSSLDLQRAEREARLAAMVNHPHVVAVFDLVPEGDHQWLVMEYVEGQNLSGMIERDGGLPPGRVARLIVQAADALAAAHAAGIVHRDVKPSNILVTDDEHVKLTDFGIARGTTDVTLTQTGMVTGSPAYLAPEVATGGSATPESDVWSLGATVFHALAGRPPYDAAEHVLGTLYRIVHDEPPRLPNAGPLAPLLEATMSRDPAARWTMRQVREFLVSIPDAAEALERTRETVPVAVAPAPERAAGGRRSRVGWARVGWALAVLALVLVLGFAGWRWLAPGGDGNETNPNPTSTPTPSEEPTDEGPTAEGMEQFVEDYLLAVTSDPRAAWRMLTPAFQQASGGFSGYTAFWGTMESANPRDIVADPETLTVSYTVDYVSVDGSRSSDDVTLVLEYVDGRYRIADEP